MLGIECLVENLVRFLNRVWRFVLVFVGMVLFGVFVSGIFDYALGDYYYAKGVEASKNNQIVASLKYLDQAIEKNPNEPHYYRQKAIVYIAINDFENAYEMLQKSEELNQQNLLTKTDNLFLYFVLANNSNQENYLEISKSNMRQIKEQNPTNVSIFVKTAKYEKLLGLEEDYKKSIQRIQELRPDLLAWHPDLMTIQ